MPWWDGSTLTAAAAFQACSHSREWSTISLCSVDRPGVLLWLQNRSCVLVLCSPTRFSTAFQNSYDVLFFLDSKCKNILVMWWCYHFDKGFCGFHGMRGVQVCSTLAAAGIWNVASGACWALWHLCVVRCQAGIAAGFDGVIACPVSEQMLFCFDHPCLGWRLNIYFNCAPVTVLLLYHLCFSWPQKMALGSLLAKLSAKVPKQCRWGRESAAVLLSSAPWLQCSGSRLATYYGRVRKGNICNASSETCRRMVMPSTPLLGWISFSLLTHCFILPKTA